MLCCMGPFAAGRLYWIATRASRRTVWLKWFCGPSSCLDFPPAWEPGGTETAAGMLADSWTAEDDRILDEIHEERQRSAFREIPE